MISAEDKAKYADVEFDTNKSSSSAQTIEAFMDREISKCDVKDIPGVGPKLAEDLTKRGITTAAQLLGCFLLHVTADSSTKEVCDNIYGQLLYPDGRNGPGINTNTAAALVDERGAGVPEERLRVIHPHLERESMSFSEDPSRHRNHPTQQYFGFFEAL